MVTVSKLLEIWGVKGMVIVLDESWFPAFGFDVGQKVVVEVTHGQIVIKAVQHKQ